MGKLLGSATGIFTKFLAHDRMVEALGEEDMVGSLDERPKEDEN